MFQLSIDNRLISIPMSYEEGCIWLENLAVIFPHEVIWLKRINSKCFWQQVDALIVFPLEKGNEVQI